MSVFRTSFLLTTALLVVAPAMADEVNIYSYRQPELIKPLTDAFTVETGIKANVAFLDKGMVERLVAEGDRSLADVILTVDISRLSEAVEAGVTQPVTSDVLTQNIPDHLRHPDGEWFGLTTRARILYASKERVKEGEVTTYEDLSDPKWKGRICTRSGSHVYTLGIVSAMIAHHGKEATQTWLEGVKANLARKPQGNDRAQVKAIWAGECDVALGNTYYIGKMLEDPEQKEWVDSVNVAFPVFENSGTHVNVSGVAMTKAAPHKENALLLMEFLSSPKAQELYAKMNYEYPVGPGTKPSDIVASWGDLTADETNLAEIGKYRSEALKLVEIVDFDG